MGEHLSPQEAAREPLHSIHSTEELLGCIAEWKAMRKIANHIYELSGFVRNAVRVFVHNVRPFLEEIERSVEAQKRQKELMEMIEAYAADHPVMDVDRAVRGVIPQGRLDQLRVKWYRHANGETPLRKPLLRRIQESGIPQNEWVVRTLHWIFGGRARK